MYAMENENVLQKYVIMGIIILAFITVSLNIMVTFFMFN